MTNIGDITCLYNKNNVNNTLITKIICKTIATVIPVFGLNILTCGSNSFAK